MSASSSISQSTYCASEPETPKTASYEDQHQCLADQLLNIKVTKQESEGVEPTLGPEVAKSAVYYQRTGVITNIGEDHILIDGKLMFDTIRCGLSLQVQDKVLYLCRKDENDSIMILKILENYVTFWGDEDENVEESCYNVIEHVFVREVDRVEDNIVYVQNSSLNFDLSSVTAPFIPIPGDWLELMCKVKFDEDKPMDITFDMIVEILSFKPRTSMVKSAVITDWTGEFGICDDSIFFDEHCIVVNLANPIIGSKVFVEAIESNQDGYSWRALNMFISEPMIIPETKPNDLYEKSLEVGKDYYLEVTYLLKFDEVKMGDVYRYINLQITNKGPQFVCLKRIIILKKKKHSQISRIRPWVDYYPIGGNGDLVTFKIYVHPKHYGKRKETLLLCFAGFKIKRTVEINVLDDTVSDTSGTLVPRVRS